MQGKCVSQRKLAAANAQVHALSHVGSVLCLVMPWCTRLPDGTDWLPMVAGQANAQEANRYGRTDIRPAGSGKAGLTVLLGVWYALFRQQACF